MQFLGEEFGIENIEIENMNQFCFQKVYFIPFFINHINLKIFLIHFSFRKQFLVAGIL